jgi:hypothetical protein
MMMNALSVQLVSLLQGGVSLQYERFVLPAERISVATSIGMRVSGGHDYDVLESGYGCEGRFYFLKGKGMAGPFMSLRVDTGLTRVSDAEDGRVLGSNFRIAESFNTGVRIVFFDRLEVTPSIGVGMRTDFDPRGRLPPWTRPELLRLGLTLGALF